MWEEDKGPSRPGRFFIPFTDAYQPVRCICVATVYTETPWKQHLFLLLPNKFQYLYLLHTLLRHYKVSCYPMVPGEKVTAVMLSCYPMVPWSLPLEEPVSNTLTLWMLAAHCCSDAQLRRSWVLARNPDSAGSWKASQFWDTDAPFASASLVEMQESRSRSPLRVGNLVRH